MCWQLPLRREDQVEEDGHVISTIRQWDRRHWGRGGLEFHWWCTEDPEAFVGKVPVYEEMEAELTEMVGPTVYKQFLAYIKQRERLREQRVPLPHPAVRKRSMSNGNGNGNRNGNANGNVSGDGSAGADGNGRGNANGTRMRAPTSIGTVRERTRPRISQNWPHKRRISPSWIRSRINRTRRPSSDLPTRVARRWADRRSTRTAREAPVRQQSARNTPPRSLIVEVPNR